MKEKVFLPPNDQRLYEISKEVPVQDLKKSYVRNILKKMKTIAGLNQHRDKKSSVMVGLAAPQIGYFYRIVLVDLNATRTRNHKVNNNIFMVNPVILSKGEKLVSGREGCYSTNLDSFKVNGLVLRNDKVKVKFLTENGEAKIEEFKGFTARIIQHEVDHLNGKVFVHRIKKEKDLHIVFKSELRQYKKKFSNWERTLNPKTYFRDIAGIVK